MPLVAARGVWNVSINVVLMDRQKTRRYPAMGQGALRSSSYTIHRGRLVAFLTSGCILENPKIRKSAHFSNYENCAARFVRKFLYKNFYAPKAACICELLLGFSRSAQKKREDVPPPSRVRPENYALLIWLMAKFVSLLFVAFS